MDLRKRRGGAQDMIFDHQCYLDDRYWESQSAFIAC